MITSFVNRLWPTKRKRVAVFLFDGYPAAGLSRAGFTDTLTKKSSTRYSFRSFNALGSKSRAEDLMTMILRSDMDLIFSIGTTCTLIAKHATEQAKKLVPIIFSDVRDPIQLRIVDSHTHSGNHTTGVVSFSYNYEERLLHLLNVQPRAQHALVAYNPQESALFSQEDYKQIAIFLSKHGITTTPVEIYHKDEVYSVIQKNITLHNPDIILTLRDTTLMAGMAQLVAAARRAQVSVFASDIGSIGLGASFGCGDSEYRTGEAAAHKARLILERKLSPALLPLSLLSETYHLKANKKALLEQKHSLNLDVLAWITKHGEIL